MAGVLRKTMVYLGLVEQADDEYDDLARLGGAEARPIPWPHRPGPEMRLLCAFHEDTLVAALLLVALPGYWLAARLNVLASLATFIAALFLLVQRPASGIWGGLWCLPEFGDRDAAERRVRRAGQTAAATRCHQAAQRAGSGSASSAVRSPARGSQVEASPADPGGSARHRADPVAPLHMGGDVFDRRRYRCTADGSSSQRAGGAGLVGGPPAGRKC